MGFSQGLSGLNAASAGLDVIGNNIANSATVGFKAGSAVFSDVFASSRIGMGVQVSGISQRFSAGTISSTNNELDMAIDGQNGFFRLQDTDGSILYSRNGQFFENENHQIVNIQGHVLTGYPAGAVGADPVPLSIPSSNIAPQATDSLAANLNLDANEPVIDPALKPFDPTDSSTFSDSTPMTVYDSLGNSHVLTQYFIKRSGSQGTASNWEVQYALDGKHVPGNAQALTFDASGRMTSPIAQVSKGFADPGGGDSPAADLNISFNYGGSSQYGGKFRYDMLQNGYQSGEYVRVSLAADGRLMAQYSNDKSQEIGTVVLADFNNLQGLQAAGGNAWMETVSSGPAVLGQPGSNGLSLLVGQAVEASNVDMGQELVNMIIAQRTYQANAQTIKTQDGIMQTLVTMR